MSSRKDMKVKMEHGLSCTGTVIDDHAIPAGIQSFCQCDGLRDEKKVADEVLVRLSHAVNIGNMSFRNDQGVDRRLRIHIFERQGELIFIHDFCRYRFIDDPAKNAIGVVAHGLASRGSAKLLKKQLRAPVWHAGPVWSTLIRSVS